MFVAQLDFVRAYDSAPRPHCSDCKIHQRSTFVRMNIPARSGMLGISHDFHLDALGCARIVGVGVGVSRYDGTLWRDAGVHGLLGRRHAALGEQRRPGGNHTGRPKCCRTQSWLALGLLKCACATIYTWTVFQTKTCGARPNIPGLRHVDLPCAQLSGGHSTQDSRRTRSHQARPAPHDMPRVPDAGRGLGSMRAKTSRWSERF